MYFYLVNNQIFIIRTSNENKIKLLQCEIIVKKISTNVRLISKTCLSLQRKFKIKSGGLAHLARARHWQCRGDRFESGNLHKRKSGLKEALKPILVLFLWPIFKLLV